MNLAWTMTAALLLTMGCGSAYDYSPVGIYTGTAVLLPGTTPGCASVADPSVSCCDDYQAVGLTVSSLSDGYYVDGWPANTDGSGALYWQESDVVTDPDYPACIDSAATDESLTRNGFYSFTLVKTQTCPGTSQSFQCDYGGQLAFH